MVSDVIGKFVTHNANHIRKNMTKAAGSLREAMPLVAAFIDDCRQYFGADQINASIKAGINGQPTFWASENGHEVGTKAPDHGYTVKGADLLPCKPTGAK